MNILPVLSDYRARLDPAPDVRRGFRRSTDGADAAGLVAIRRGLGSGIGLLPKRYVAGG